MFKNNIKLEEFDPKTHYELLYLYSKSIETIISLFEEETIANFYPEYKLIVFPKLHKVKKIIQLKSSTK